MRSKGGDDPDAGNDGADKRVVWTLRAESNRLLACGISFSMCGVFLS